MYRFYKTRCVLENSCLFPTLAFPVFFFLYRNFIKHWMTSSRHSSARNEGCPVSFVTNSRVKNREIVHSFGTGISEYFSRNSVWTFPHTFEYIYIYIGCPRRNGQNFGRVFLMLNYTDITQNTYSQSWTVTEIMARKVWNFDSYYSLIDYQIHIETGRNMWFLCNVNICT